MFSEEMLFIFRRNKGISGKKTKIQIVSISYKNLCIFIFTKHLSYYFLAFY